MFVGCLDIPVGRGICGDDQSQCISSAIARHCIECLCRRNASFARCASVTDAIDKHEAGCAFSGAVAGLKKLREGVELRESHGVAALHTYPRARMQRPNISFWRDRMSYWSAIAWPMEV